MVGESAFRMPENRWVELDRLRARSPMIDAVIDEVNGRQIRIGDHWLTDFASCNYLGLDLDPEVMSAIDEQIRRWGTHPSWSRMLGSPRLYVDIEERLTELLGAPDTLVLPTITHIHTSVIPALAGSGTVFLEAAAHKTIYDGSRFAQGLGATMHRFHADDPEQLARLLRASRSDQPRLVCMDGVNSMTGNVPDLPGYAALCRDHGALLYIDDAHGFGVIGERPDPAVPYGYRGNSVVRYCGESYDNVILVGGFSKAYSSILAFLAMPTTVKNYLKVAAPPYLYSGPSPTASLASVLAGMDINERRGDALRGKLHRLTGRVLERAGQLGLDTPNRAGTPIIELPLGERADLAEVGARLWRHGIYVTLAGYPLVPRDQVGIRVQLTAAHTDGQVDRLLAVLTELAMDGGLRTTGAATAEAGLSRVPYQRMPANREVLVEGCGL
jgi:8-amino-7-oxononanoate synthase